MKEGIRLTWDRPTTYAGGAKMKDLGGFTITRIVANGPLEKLGEIEVHDEGRFQVQNTFSFIDGATVIGTDLPLSGDFQYHRRLHQRAVERCYDCASACVGPAEPGHLRRAHPGSNQVMPGRVRLFAGPRCGRNEASPIKPELTSATLR